MRIAGGVCTTRKPDDPTDVSNHVIVSLVEREKFYHDHHEYIAMSSDQWLVNIRCQLCARYCRYSTTKYPGWWSALSYWARKNSYVCPVDDALDERELALVLAHEFGHSFGAVVRFVPYCVPKFLKILFKTRNRVK